MLMIKHRSKKRTPPFKCRFSAPISRLVISYYGFALAHLVKMVLSGGTDYCYSDIGCFPLSSEFFHPQHRPINLRPWHRDLIKTQFELFNKDHPEGYMLLPWNKPNLLHSGFDSRLETKIIVPGWLDNITRSHWLRKLRDAFLWLWRPVNIIVVRWRNFTPYTMATANTRVVGAELANLLKFIEAEMDYDRSYYHIIGHSLGAHVAGYCGDRIYGLGRITALDPARPFFQGMPKSVRLDRSDAKFIDAIHSDFTPENAFFILMSYGMTTPVGHLDFYPNGPPLFQPGCLRDTLTSVQDGIAKGLQHNSLSTAFLEAMRYMTACDHQRSHEWFIESITNRECAFVGVRCNEFEGMINGRCTCDDSPSACAIMGIHADQMYMNNVHEELWPVRVGSIQYKYNTARPRSPASKPAHFAPHSLAPPTASSALPSPLGQLALYDAPSSPLDDAALAALALQQLQGAPLTKEQIYAQLKEQVSDLQRAPEPSISAYEHVYQGSESTTVSYQDEAPPPVGAEHLDVQASELERQVAVLDDLAFVQYLRINLLTRELESVSETRAGQKNGTRASESSLERRRDDGSKKPARGERDLHIEAAESGDKTDEHAAQYEGHPVLLSSLNRDIESWYEDNSKWFLKTNDRPNYCSNQYQLMIFLGPLKSSSGRDSLRANLVVSVIGSRGQLLKQRFVPRGSSLSSFTMQPFFILLEGSYSLGQIKSVALAWEARNDPQPVQATVKFQSSLLEAVGSQVPAYQAKNNPWMPESLMKHDKSSGFQFHRRRQPQGAHTLAAPSGSSPLAAASNLLKSNIGGHYSNKYTRMDAQRTESSKNFGRRSDDPVQESRRQCRRPSKTNGWPQWRRKQCGLGRVKRDSGPSRRADIDYALGLPDPNQALDYEEEADELEEEEAAEQLLASASVFRPNLVMSAEQTSPMYADLPPQMVRPMDGAAPLEAMFVPLVDLPHPSERIPPASGAPPDLGQHSDEKLSLELHNLDDLLSHEGHHEDSIVVNQVIVSPLQAYYGQHGRNRRIFCPPRHKRKLLQDKTVRLKPALMGKC